MINAKDALEMDLDFSNIMKRIDNAIEIYAKEGFDAIKLIDYFDLSKSAQKHITESMDQLGYTVTITNFLFYKKAEIRWRK